MIETPDLEQFCNKHRLPNSFPAYAKQWFDPVVAEIAAHQKARGPVCIGVSGCQGSGKSTFADYCALVLEQQFNLNCAVLSLDDLYLTKAQRAQLGADIHPLFATRGVPGTHDTELGKALIHALKQGSSAVELPIFDKLSDDRSAQTTSCHPAVDIVLFEGWCLGAAAQAEDALRSPCNSLESSQDPEGIWRTYANEQLRQEYDSLFSAVDYWIMLKAPSFEQVFKWRLEQEQKLVAAQHAAGNTQVTGMREDEVRFFIAHYQRITEHLLKTLPGKVNYLLELDESRQIYQASRPVPVELDN